MYVAIVFVLVYISCIVVHSISFNDDMIVYEGQLSLVTVCVCTCVHVRVYGVVMVCVFGEGGGGETHWRLAMVATGCRLTENIIVQLCVALPNCKELANLNLQG